MPEKNYPTFGSLIRQLRTRLEKTQAEVARELEVSHQAVSDLEKDKKKTAPPIGRLFRLARSLQIRPGVALKASIRQWKCVLIEIESTRKQRFLYWVGLSIDILQDEEMDRIETVLKNAYCQRGRPEHAEQ